MSEAEGVLLEVASRFADPAPPAAGRPTATSHDQDTAAADAAAAALTRDQLRGLQRWSRDMLMRLRG